MLEPSHNARASVLRFLDYCVEPLPKEAGKTTYTNPFPKAGWLVGVQIYAAYVWWQEKHGEPLLPMPLVMRIVKQHLILQPLDCFGHGVYLARLKKGVGVVGQRDAEDRIETRLRDDVKAELDRIVAARRAIEARLRELRRRRTSPGRKRRRRAPPAASRPAQAQTPARVDVDEAIAAAQKLLEEL
jgi:hypothetical protein